MFLRPVIPGMYHLFVIVLSLLVAVYAAFVAHVAWGFFRVRRAAASAVPGARPLPQLSVVIPARNEAATVAACLRSIFENDYPADRYEVIVVDDHSDDATRACIRALDPPPGVTLRLVALGEETPGGGGNRNAALRRGLREASGDAILTTDADCTVGPHWMRAMASYLSGETDFVAGPVRFSPGSTLFGRLQALEFIALVATGAGGIGVGRPNMCNAANVLYRRSVAEEFGRTLEAGSPACEEVLVHHLARRSPRRVAFCPHPDALVDTTPLLQAGAFWAQRRRWAGTAPRYPRRMLVATIVGVYAFYLLLFAGLLAAPWVDGLWLPVAAALVAKVVVELALVVPACRHFEQTGLLPLFVPGQLVQIPYVVTVGAAAALAPAAWKGRPAFQALAGRAP